MSILSSFWNQFIETISKDQKKFPLLFPLLKQLYLIELTEEKIVLGCQNQGLKFYLNKGKPREELENALTLHAGKKIILDLVVAPLGKKKLKETPLFNFQPSLGDLFYRTG